METPGSEEGLGGEPREPSEPPAGAQAPSWFWAALLVAVGLANVLDVRGSWVDVHWLGFVPFVLLAGVVVAASRVGWKYTVFALIPLCGTLLLLELGFRFYFHQIASPERQRAMARPDTGDLGDGHVYVPHHYSIYSLQPGLDLGDGLRHNSLGLRDHREFDPDEDAVRIVFIGGSTTYTIRIRRNDEIFSHGLEELLNERYAEALDGRPLQVINAGMGGATSAENLVRMIFTVSELRPDVVVIQHGINDGWPRSTGSLRSDYGNYRRRWEKPSIFTENALAHALTLSALQRSMLGNFVANRLALAKVWHLYSFTNRPQEGDASANVARNDARYFERNSRYMVALAREMGAVVVLATLPTTEQAGVVATTTPEHNALLARVATELGVDFFDFAAEMKTDEAHLPDGVHVSELGSDLKRDLYYDYLIRSGIVERAIAAMPEPGRS